MAPKTKATSMELAYNKLIKKILVERLAPGTPLREEKLAAEFKISPTPVREAFRRLENEGWVESIPYRGTFIRSYSQAEIDELFIIREALETTAAVRACEKATPKELERIEETLKDEQKYLQKNVKNGKCRPSVQEDIAFHEAIVDAAHSEQLAQRSSLLRRRIDQLIWMDSDTPVDVLQLEMVHEEHLMIANALKRGWGDIAENLMRKHLRIAFEKRINSQTLKK